MPAEVGMRADVDRDQDIARRAPFARRLLSLSAEADFFPLLDAGRDFDHDRLGLARAAIDRQLGLAAGDGRGEGDFDFGRQIGPAACRPGSFFAAPLGLSELAKNVSQAAEAAPLESLAKNLAEVDFVRPAGPRAAGTTRAPRPVPGGAGPPAPADSNELP